MTSYAQVRALFSRAVRSRAALQSARAELAAAIKNEAMAEHLRHFHLHDVLVAAQVAMSIELLVASVLVVRSLQHALSLRLGFEPRHAAAVAFDLGLQGYDETRAREFRRRASPMPRWLPYFGSLPATSARRAPEWSPAAILRRATSRTPAGYLPNRGNNLCSRKHCNFVEADPPGRCRP